MKKLKPSPSGKSRRWWFGETRTIEQQLTGLDQLFEMVKGCSVLDVGCAEGAISHECSRRGARFVLGLEIVPEFVEKAERAAASGDCQFIQADANTWAPVPFVRYDIVLMLAILQKLKDPSSVVKRLAALATKLVVIRLPPGDSPVIVDQRSGLVPHDIEYAMREAGFGLVGVADGPVAEAGRPEWVGYFVRNKVIKPEDLAAAEVPTVVIPQREPIDWTTPPEQKDEDA